MFATGFSKLGLLFLHAVRFVSLTANISLAKAGFKDLMFYSFDK